MSIRPLRDLLYIIPMEDPSEIGQIIRPDNYIQREDQGIVKYRGPKTSGEIKVGDHVSFSGWAGDKIIIEDEGVLFVIPENAINFIYLESEVSNHVLTIPQVELAVKRAVSEMCRLSNTSDKERVLLTQLEARLLEHLDNRFYHELHF